MVSRIWGRESFYYSPIVVKTLLRHTTHGDPPPLGRPLTVGSPTLILGPRCEGLVGHSCVRPRTVVIGRFVHGLTTVTTSTVTSVTCDSPPFDTGVRFGYVGRTGPSAECPKRKVLISEESIGRDVRERTVPGPYSGIRGIVRDKETVSNHPGKEVKIRDLRFYPLDIRTNTLLQFTGGSPRNLGSGSPLHSTSDLFSDRG